MTDEPKVTEDNTAKQDPNENTIFTVCSADELGRFTTDGWEMVRVLETPGVGVSTGYDSSGTHVSQTLDVTFFRADFLLRRTRDVDNLERAQQAERKAKDAHKEYENAVHRMERAEEQDKRTSDILSSNRKTAEVRDRKLNQYSIALKHLLTKLGKDKLEELLGDEKGTIVDLQP